MDSEADRWRIDGYELRLVPKQERARRSVVLTLEATAELLQEPDEFSMSEVAKRSGVSKGTIYRYFPSLAHIVAALAMPYRTRALARIETVLGATTNLVEAVVGVNRLFDELMQLIEVDGLARALFITSYNRRHVGEILNSTSFEIGELASDHLGDLLNENRAQHVRKAAIGLQTARATLELSIGLASEDRQALIDEFRTMMFLAADINLHRPEPLSLPDNVAAIDASSIGDG